MNDDPYAGLSPAERLEIETYDLDVTACPPRSSLGWNLVAAKRRQILDGIRQRRGQHG